MEPCPTRLLADEPSSADEFGSHDRVAQAIFATLVSEAGGRAVGLMGPWGSGKSTVVALAKHRFERPAKGEDVDRSVFLFDAWAHQGDPLRRSFLEALVQHLLRVRWIDEETAGRSRARLSGSFETTVSDSTPKLKPRGRLFVASLALVPIGLVIFAQFRSFLGRALGLGIALLPHLFAIGLWLSWRPTWKFLTKRFWRENSHHRGESVLDLFVRETQTTTTTSRIKTPEPTSIEFRQLFFQLLEEALDRPPRRLLVVLDNLDRVPSADALKVWATMRTFFDPLDPEASFLPRLWVLVPFDPSGISKLWGGPATQLDSETAKLAEAFLEKSFHLVFRVPSPVLSKWKTYFEDRFAEAFPNHDSNGEGAVLVYRLFRSNRIAEGKRVTPREVKVFVNAVGTLHRQWNDEIPLPSQALYVLLADKIAANPGQLMGDELIPPGTAGLLPELPDWRRDLAAIHFNVNPQAALEVLIGPEVESALEQGDSNKLRELAETPGFAAVTEQVIDEQHFDWQQSQPSALAYSARLFNSISDLYVPSPVVWRQLTRAARNVPSWQTLSAPIGEGLGALVDNAPESEHELVATAILRAVSNTEFSLDGEEDQRPSAQDWALAAVELITVLRRRGLRGPIEEHFRVPGEGLGIVIAVQEAVSAGWEEVATEFARAEDPNSVIAQLSQDAGAGRTPERSKVFDLLLRIHSSVDWKPLWEALHPRFVVGQMTEAAEIEAASAWTLMLIQAGVIEGNDPSLTTLSTSGNLFHQLQTAVSEGNDQATANCLVLTLLCNPEPGISSDTGNSAGGRHFFSQFLADPSGYSEVLAKAQEAVARYSLLSYVLTLPQNVQSTTRFVAMVSAGLADHIAEYVTAEEFVNAFPLLGENLSDEDLRQAVSSMVRDGKLRSHLRQEFSIANSRLYSLVLQALSPSDRPAFQRFLKAGLSELTAEEWATNLKRGTYAIQLVEQIQPDLELNLSTELAQALQEHVSHLLQGGDIPGSELLREGWPHVIDALSSDLRETFLDNTRDELLRSPEADLSTFLPVYGYVLLKSPDLDEKADDLTRLVIPAIVERGKEVELRWLDKLLRERPAIVQKSKRGSKKMLQERIRDALESDPEPSIKQLLEAIKNSFR